MHRTITGLLTLALATSGTAACSIKKMAINGLADTLAASGDSFSSDEDPDLIRDAVPFSLKTIESLLAEVPEHKGLLLTACSGFTQYAYAFVQTDAELIEPKDYEASVAGRERALKMYQRALGYCLRRVELTHKGFRAAVEKDPTGTMKAFSREEVAVLYWTGATWGALVSADPKSRSCSISCPSCAPSWTARSSSTRPTSLAPSTTS